MKITCVRCEREEPALGSALCPFCALALASPQPALTGRPPQGKPIAKRRPPNRGNVPIGRLVVPKP